MILGTGIGIQFTSGAGFSLADSLINSLCERSTTCENKAGTKSILNDLNVSNGCGNVLLLIAGQSNAKGSLGPDPKNVPAYLKDNPIPSTFIWKGSNFAQLTINNNETSNDNHGIELNFGYLSQLTRNGNVYIVKVAEGSTGFVDNQWNPGDPLYNDLVTQANAAIADLNSTNTQFHFGGLYWNQGEKETSTGGTSDIYASLLGTMVSGLRSAITGASNMRFMFTRLGTYFVTRSTASNATQLTRSVEVRAQQETANTQISNSFLINQDDLEHHGDEVHANSASQNLLASRVFDIIKDLL